MAKPPSSNLLVRNRLRLTAQLCDYCLLLLSGLTETRDEQLSDSKCVWNEEETKAGIEQLSYIRDLVIRLGGKDKKATLEAEKELIQLGKTALDQLRQILYESNNKTLSVRIRWVIRKIYASELARNSGNNDQSSLQSRDNTGEEVECAQKDTSNAAHDQKRKGSMQSRNPRKPEEKAKKRSLQLRFRSRPF